MYYELVFIMKMLKNNTCALLSYRHYGNAVRSGIMLLFLAPFYFQQGLQLSHTTHS